MEMTFPMSRGLLRPHRRSVWYRLVPVEMTFPMSRGLLLLGCECGNKAFDLVPVEMTFPMSRGLLPSLKKYLRGHGPRWK